MVDNEKDIIENTPAETEPENDGFQFLGDPNAQPATAVKKSGNFKRFVPILSLCVIAVVLFVAVFVLKKAVPPEDETPGIVEESNIKLFDFTGTSADRLEIKNTNDEFAFVRKLEKTYYIEGKEEYPVSNSTILTTLTYVGSLAAVTEVEKDVTDFEQYGLDKPLSSVKWIKDDTTHTFDIGALAPSGNYYLRVDGGNTVYTFDKATASYFLSPRMDYYNTTVFEFDEEQDASYINYFSIQKKGAEKLEVKLQDLADESINSAYKIVEPITHDFAIEKSNAIIELLKNLTTLTVYDDDLSPESLKKYGLDDPTYTFTYTNVAQTYTAYFGKKSDEGYVYMYAEDRDFVYIIDEKTINILTYDFADYCESMSYTRSYDTVDNIVIQGGGKTYEIDISGTADDGNLTAYINGKNVEYESFSSLYAHIISIEFTDIGNKNPGDDLLVTITVNCLDGTTDVLKYYKQSDMNSFLELNGEGRLIVATSKVEQILKFAQQLYDGEEIIVEW